MYVSYIRMYVYVKLSRVPCTPCDMFDERKHLDVCVSFDLVLFLFFGFMYVGWSACAREMIRIH